MTRFNISTTAHTDIAARQTVTTITFTTPVELTIAANITRAIAIDTYLIGVAMFWFTAWQSARFINAAIATYRKGRACRSWVENIRAVRQAHAQLQTEDLAPSPLTSARLDTLHWFHVTDLRTVSTEQVHASIALLDALPDKTQAHVAQMDTLALTA